MRAVLHTCWCRGTNRTTDERALSRRSGTEQYRLAVLVREFHFRRDWAETGRIKSTPSPLFNPTQPSPKEPGPDPNPSRNFPFLIHTLPSRSVKVALAFRLDVGYYCGATLPKNGRHTSIESDRRLLYSEGGVRA